MLSLSGWVMQQLGKPPVTGDSFDYGKLQVTVKAVERHKASELEIKIKQ